MSLRSEMEIKFSKRLKEKLDALGAGYYRTWLNSSLYNNKAQFEKKDIEPIKLAKVIYPIHSYEIFEMEDCEIEVLQEKICFEIEKYFRIKINDLANDSDNIVIAYVEGDLSISLDYRVAIISLYYNIFSSVTPIV